MDPQPRLKRYGSGRFVPTLVGDPGPVPVVSRVERRRLAHIALELDESVHRAWADAVKEIRATGDLKAILALQRFALALENFHNRPRL